ncbi:Mitochondrial distribution and morphology protein 10 [Coemansia sp. RSA 988]|nr:Mitochondrial distribution and morphology protein 10 [Coemansia sp. RSA 988]
MVYTTSDYFPLLVRQFHKETNWNECNSYATFRRSSGAILDFGIPYGLSVSTGRSVGSHLNSQLVFSMVPGAASSIGYLAASRPLFATQPIADAETVTAADKTKSEKQLDPGFASSAKTGGLTTAQQTYSDIISNPALTDPKEILTVEQTQLPKDTLDAQNLLQHIRAGAWRCDWNTRNETQGVGSSSSSDYLMVAQMYPSLASITGSYVTRRSAISEVMVSGVSVAGVHPDFQLVVQHFINQPRWSSEATFGTNGRLAGLRGLYNFGEVEAPYATGRTYNDSDSQQMQRALREDVFGRLSVGGEVYFGAQEASGGISAGIRYRHEQPLLSELTCVLNPIMGHTSLTWTRQLQPRVCAAARYDFNAFSLSSELAVGVEWQLDHSSIAKMRWSDSQGLRCLVDTRFSNMVFSMGLDLRPKTIGTESVAEASLGIKRLVRSFGLQLQWFL